MELDYIKQGDCLELLKEIPDKSVDLVVTDPPYNVKKAYWDNIKNYISWCGKWLKECERVLKDNGTLCFFHNDMPQIFELAEHIRLNTNFVYNSFIIWNKENFRALSWKNPSEKNNLRCWFNVCEYCLVYVKGDSIYTEWNRTGLDRIKKDVSNFTNLRQYSYKILYYISEKYNTTSSKKILMQEIGGKIDHFTRYNSSQWELCTPETYQELIDKFNIDKMVGFREYESLRQEYESLRFTHNLDENHNNVWTSKYKNNGKLHPTQKPIDIIERLIKTHSKENAIVLDPFLGVGTTAVAAINTNRHYIGFELDTKYFDIAKNRIEETKSKKNVA